MRPAVEAEVWKEISCLSCANCCKKMTPTFTIKDIKRISAHLNETPEVFKKKWLKTDTNKDMVNVKESHTAIFVKAELGSKEQAKPVDNNHAKEQSRKVI